jgi:hypothetical protein
MFGGGYLQHYVELEPRLEPGFASHQQRLDNSKEAGAIRTNPYSIRRISNLKVYSEGHCITPAYYHYYYYYYYCFVVIVLWCVFMKSLGVDSI